MSMSISGNDILSRLRKWCIASVVFAVSISAAANEIDGRVVKVSDGDTITILDELRVAHKIRLAGIDAPEKAQAFGRRSKEHLSSQIFGRQVIANCGKTDKYRRQVCKILVDDVDVNRAQIEAGLAWWYRQFAREQPLADRLSYEAAEDRAKASKQGLWRDMAPMPPWEFRHNKKTQTE